MDDLQLYEIFQNYFAKQLLRNQILKLNVQNNNQKKKAAPEKGREFYRREENS